MVLDRLSGSKAAVWPAFAAAAAEAAVFGRVGARIWDIARRAHCPTNGRSTDVLAAAARLRRPKVSVEHPAAEQVRRDGWAMLPDRLDAAQVDELRAATLVLPGEPKDEAGLLPRQVVDFDRPVAPVYYFDAPTLSAVPAYRRLIGDEHLASVGRAYLGVEPILSTAQAWWSLPTGEPSASNAQMWHFDLSHPAWVKVFVYLTDVDEGSGPHCVIAGSHHRDREGRDLRRSLARRGNDEIAVAYPGREVRIVGPAGTMFAVDTRCWHKGQPPDTAPRLMVETYWTSCQVGPAPVEETLRHAATPTP